MSHRRDQASRGDVLGPKQATLNRKYRDMAERSALRSSVHLKLPRPTAAKSPSQTSELMWELPSLNIRQQRRRSNPSLFPDTISPSGSYNSSGSKRESFNRSRSQPNFRLSPGAISKEETNSTPR